MARAGIRTDIPAVDRSEAQNLADKYLKALFAAEENKRVVLAASLWQVRQPVYKDSLDRGRRYEPWLGEFRDLLSQGAYPYP